MDTNYLEYIIVDLVNDSTGIIHCTRGLAGDSYNSTEPYAYFRQVLQFGDVSKIKVTALNDNYYCFPEYPNIGTRKAVLIDCKWEDFDKINYKYVVQNRSTREKETTYHKTDYTPAIIGDAFTELCALPGSLFVKDSDHNMVTTKKGYVERLNYWIDKGRVADFTTEQYDCYYYEGGGEDGLSYDDKFGCDYENIVIPLKH